MCFSKGTMIPIHFWSRTRVCSPTLIFLLVQDAYRSKTYSYSNNTYMCIAFSVSLFVHRVHQLHYFQLLSRHMDVLNSPRGKRVIGYFQQFHSLFAIQYLMVRTRYTSRCNEFPMDANLLAILSYD